MAAFAKLPLDTTPVDDFVLTRLQNKSADVSFGGVKYSPKADASTPPEMLSKKDPNRVMAKNFVLMIPDVDSKFTKQGVHMMQTYNEDTSSYEDRPWNPTADKHQVQISLDPSHPIHAMIIERLTAFGEHLSAQFCARHNLHKSHVFTPAVVRTTSFEGGDGTEITRAMLRLLVDKDSTFRFNGASHKRDVLGLAGPFFPSHRLEMLAIRPQYVMARQQVSEADESIYHFAVSVKWTIMFANVSPPATREDGRTYEEAQQDYVAELRRAEEAALDEFSQYCANREQGQAVAPGSPVRVKEEPQSPPKAPRKQAPAAGLGLAAGSGLSKAKKNLASELAAAVSTAESTPADSHESQARKKKAARRAAAKAAARQSAESSVSSETAPPSLSHLLG
jgi:hypothetical protein